MSTSSHDTPLKIFCGKGGVGKTSIAIAFALRHAAQGQPILVVTSHPLRELAVSVSLSGLKEANPAAAANLFIVHLDPLEILAGTVKRVVPSELLVKKVLASPIYKSLIEVAPGLKEIAFLGRLHELAQQRSSSDTAGKFKILVWDAPASGHFLQMLKVSRNFEDYLSGPFALMGKQVSQFFSDASNLSVIPVTTLEEMAVDETIEMAETLSKDLKIPPSSYVCNMASPLLSSSDAEVDALLREVAPAGEAPEELKFILARHGMERALFKKLASSTDAPLHIVKRMPNWNTDLELLTDISQQLDGISTF